jgi:hypothetical protein
MLDGLSALVEISESEEKTDTNTLTGKQARLSTRPKWDGYTFSNANDS